MHESRKYLCGGGGPGPSVTVFFSPYLNIQKSNGFFSKKTITFKAPEGSNNFQSGGGPINCLFPIRIQINCTQYGITPEITYRLQ